MSIERANFDLIEERDLQELVEAQVPEGLRLEYKRTPYGASDADKREFLKDVSAFANSQGGHLVLGIEEASSVATAIAGIGGSNPDVEILRMEQMARSGLEPSATGIRIKAIPTSSGDHALLLRVPRSWNPPHRVSAQGANRFYVRHSAGVHEASIEELRALFTQSTSALEQARQFRTERLQYIAGGRGERPLEAGGRLILHIVPVAGFLGAIRLDMEAVHAQHMAFHPLGSMGMTPRFNYFGFINQRGGDENYGYTQVFRNGALEATKADIAFERDGLRFIRGLALEKHIFEVLSQYIVGLRDMGVPAPLVIMFTLEGVQGAIYLVRRSSFGEYDPPLSDDLMTLPECILEDYGTELDHHKAVRPAFDALWNVMGYSRSQFFNEEGRWIGDSSGH